MTTAPRVRSSRRPAPTSSSRSTPTSSLRSRPATRCAVAPAFPSGMHGLLHWLTYVPDFDAPASDIAAAPGRETARRRAAGLPQGGRVTAPDRLPADAGRRQPFRRGPATRQAEARRRTRASAYHAAIAHVPIRSATSSSPRSRSRSSGAWRPIRLAAGCSIAGGVRLDRRRRPPDAAMLTEHAVNWSVLRHGGRGRPNRADGRRPLPRADRAEVHAANGRGARAARLVGHRADGAPAPPRRAAGSAEASVRGVDGPQRGGHRRALVRHNLAVLDGMASSTTARSTARSTS